MSHVQQIPRRESHPIRWLPEELDPVRELAARETEGNISQMVRKLVREALAARAAAPQR